MQTAKQNISDDDDGGGKNENCEPANRTSAISCLP